ncbi:MAG: sigma-70 family RNA polymerase sigma factor [Cyclobacteriaceae bacterium]|nr:sigma-70 family RNA polymerase sigma factor [Cyclobacteriaceae bacterium]HQQ81779.1 sigma-70 family RNA polymerase sigma factor [Cyclobacteriaceae bacterium]
MGPSLHADIIDRCRRGDQEAHYQLYRLYSRSMFNVGYRIVNNEAEAEDVLQEAFISAFRSLEHYRGDASFGAWLKRIVINKAINVIKQRRTEPLPEADFDVADDVWDEKEFPFSVDQVRRAIEALPDGYRSVLSLYLLEGYDHAEIAGILGISESTSKSQFNRSKKKLRELLEGGAS